MFRLHRADTNRKSMIWKRCEGIPVMASLCRRHAIDCLSILLSPLPIASSGDAILSI